MKILAIDTSTEACSAALYVEDDASGSNVTSRYQLAPREHSRLILKMIDDLISEAGLSVSALDAIAFGCGPGSFMGLRIAAGVVQGIAFAHDIPVIPVSTLKATAQCAYEEAGSQHVLAAIDARMGEVYWAAYSLKDNHWALHGEETVISPDKISLSDLPAESWVGAGTGWASYQDRLLKAANCPLPTILIDCFPSAEAIVKLAVDDFRSGNTVTAAEAVPVYIRNDVAKKPKPVKL
ncbi:MAG: tRNA (adenosine(37)-N6)-threonylcarbamoyltransferase complex dimerization subunit type 1 TsaB [Proteobacteria bacterium]|nr:tRNA (adenosine(37)-N6)-threonylcarbamoyltransferase complex dimerization subunit type 1 TsaB [Pseudomonadota bacterium]